MLPVESRPDLPKYSLLYRTLLKGIAPGWEKYRSICINPEMLARHVTDNPLLVMHPGFSRYRLGLTPEIDPDEKSGYKQYLTNLRRKIGKTSEQGRSILIFVPTDHLYETLDIVKPPDGTILIPTRNRRGIITSSILNVPLRNPFYKMLSEHISQAEICGEYGHNCVFSLVVTLSEGVKTSLVDGCIFPMDFRKITNQMLATVKKLRSLAPEPRKTQVIEYRKGFNKRAQLIKKVKRRQKIRIISEEKVFIFCSGLSNEGLDNLIHALTPQ